MADRTFTGRERPILFSAPMVRAVLDGSKTQTRRIVQIGDHARADLLGCKAGVATFGDRLPDDPVPLEKRCPYGKPGDRLWVRETHAQFAVGNKIGLAPQCVAYRATCREDGSFDYAQPDGEILGIKVTKWTPAIHMPRWASRITLEITDVRVQRLQAISDEDALAEGIERNDDDGVTYYGPLNHGDCRPREGFRMLWDSVPGGGPGRSWYADPWCWAITFKRLAP